MTATFSKGATNSEIDDAIRTWAFYGEKVRGLPHWGQPNEDGSLDERTYQWLSVEAALKEFGKRGPAIGLRASVMQMQMTLVLRAVYLDGQPLEKLGSNWALAVIAIRVFKRQLAARLAAEPYRKTQVERDDW